MISKRYSFVKVVSQDGGYDCGGSAGRGAEGGWGRGAVCVRPVWRGGQPALHRLPHHLLLQQVPGRPHPLTSCLLTQGTPEVTLEKTQVVLLCLQGVLTLDFLHQPVGDPLHQVCSSAELGRYLVATRDLKPGELVISETPLIIGPQVCSHNYHPSQQLPHRL